MQSRNAKRSTSRPALAHPHVQNQFHFGEWRVDLRSAELFRNGQKVPIQDKPFQVLAILLSRPDDVVTRKEIIKVLWPDSGIQAEASLNTAVRKLRAALGDSPAKPRIIGTVENRGYRLLVQPHGLSSVFSAYHPVRIAVTPLQNLGDPEFDKFADSLTEQMIVQLADPKGDLRVIVPVAGTRHRGDPSAWRDMAAGLIVDYVLGGTMTKTANRVRVNAELIRASDGLTVWKEQFVRQLVDVFSAQDEITLQVACAILQLIPHSPENRNLTTPAAYGDTLRGQHFAEKWNEPSFLRAVNYFQQAITEDPRFARAHSALARTCAGMLHYGILNPSLNYERLQVEANSALELCPGLPEAIVALGCGQLFYEANWSAAERSFQDALRISPGSGYAYESYARLLIATGRYQEAIDAAKRARELNPVSPYSITVLGAAYYFARRYEEGIRHCTECVEMEPGFSMAWAILARSQEALGRFDEAVLNYRSALECAPESAVLIANLAHGLAVAGDIDESRKLLDVVLEKRTAGYVPGYWIAMCYLGIGEVQEALKWLRTAVDEHCGWRILAAVDPKLDVIGENEDFLEVLRKIKFPQVQ